MSGNCFFLSCFFSFVSPNCKGWQFAFVGGAYPELKRAAGGDSSAVGGFVCRAFTTEAQRAGAYMRVRCFSFFAFTSSPDGRKLLSNSILRVKVSVKILHPLELIMEIQSLHP